MPLPLSDELAIRTLVADLAIQADHGEIDRYLSLFTEDAVWELPANPASGVPEMRAVGHAEIGTSVEQRRGYGVQGPGSGALHHITTLLIDGAGDEGTGHVYYHLAVVTDGKPVIRTVGQYHDRYRRTADGWRLAHRTVLIS